MKPVSRHKQRDASEAKFSPKGRRAAFGIAAALALAALAAYAQTLHFGFVNYDDPAVVSQNAHVREGLTASGVKWALTSGEFGNWFPVTRLSYLADRQWFDLDPGAEHAVNAVLNALTVVLLFGLLRSLTGSLWRSAFAAALFALHPLHVESVAWISERKDVLSGFFWFAALAAYVAYTRRPSAAHYALVAGVFMLGLMSKPVMVTLPFALLLFDFWPLRRASLPDPRWRALFREKLPLFVLSAAACILTYLVQSGAGAVAAWDALPLGQRLANGVAAYLTYILQMVWPSPLAVFYPIAPLPWWQIAGAVIALAIGSYLAVRWRHSRPWFTAGWFWYLGTMVPMLGLIQVGAAAHADRYTYIPAIGLAVIAAWGVGEAAERFPRAMPAMAAAAAAICAACFTLTWQQTRYWEDSITLFRHAVESTKGNWVAYNNLGVALRAEGQSDEAIADFHQALSYRPGFVDAFVNLCEAYNAQGRYYEGAGYCREALAINPASAEAHGDLGSALGAMGKSGEAEPHFREALRLRPNDPKAHNNLGIALANEGEVTAAIANFEAAVRLDPNYANAEFNLGAALANSGRLEQAAAHFAAALRLHPDDPRAQQGLEAVTARLREAAR